LTLENAQSYLADYKMSECGHCHRELLWNVDRIVFPPASTAPEPHEELPKSIRPDFDEARAVFNASPRSSAALLRLATQKLCIELGLDGSNLNSDIAELVKRGLPAQAQQAFDVVRVVGNNQVHPGVLDVRDDQDIAVSLFDLVNLIVEIMVAQPRRVDALFNKLPESSRKAIEVRNANAARKSR
jgi:hypothetical protein